MHSITERFIVLINIFIFCTEIMFFAETLMFCGRDLGITILVASLITIFVSHHNQVIA